MVYKDTHKTKDGRCYYFSKMVNGKRYKSKHYLNRKDAEKAEALYIIKHKESNCIEFSLLAADYFNYLKTYSKYSTIYTYLKDYNKHIYPYFASKNIYSINTLDYNVWFDEMSKKHLSAKYLNKINSLLRNIFDYGVKNYDLPSNPVVKNFKSQAKIVDDKDKIRYITKDEFDKFISVADDEMYKLLFETLFYTGCRIGELLCLQWKDVFLEQKYISITKTLYKIHDNTPTTNKTNKNRQVSIPDVLLLNLANYKAIKKDYKDFSNEWYVFGDIKTLSTTQIQRKKHQYFTDANIHEITIHEFRHSHISNLINIYLQNGGKDYMSFLQKLAARSGHTLDVMCRTYMHLFPNNQDDIVNMLNNM